MASLGERDVPPEQVRVDMPREGVKDVKKEMFKAAMKDQWEDVLEAFRTNPQAREAKLARSGDTVLHLAVSYGSFGVVQELVDLTCAGSSSASELLKIKNKRGNTPLHLAAALGRVKSCEYIAAKDPNLISARNNDDETPLFQAALHGKKEAFLYLHAMCPDYNNCKRDDGETILHCAISGEYFGLAFEIMHLYKDLENKEGFTALHNMKNMEGFTPLHILASKSSAFKSGCSLGVIDKIIYSLAKVPEKNNITADAENPGEVNPSEDASIQDKKGIPTDTENLIEVNIPSEDADEGRGSREAGEPYPSNIGDQGKQVNHTNHFENLFMVIIVVIIMVMTLLLIPLVCLFGVVIILLLPLLLGIRRFQKIKELKEKHRLAIQIMKQLVENTSMWEYDATELNPNKSQEHKDVAGSSSSENSESSDRTNKNSPDKKREGKSETPLLIAARMGVVELVEEILKQFPMAIHDENADQKNIVLLALENRKLAVYSHLRFQLSENILTESVFTKVDKEGNSALHLAANLGENQPWAVSGPAMQMLEEIIWYKSIKESILPYYNLYNENNEGNSPKEIFTNTHRDLATKGRKSIAETSNSYSVIATLVAAVAFATASTVPGGVDQNTGLPTLRDKTAFIVFAISSNVALCFSVIAIMMFLWIFTSPYDEQDSIAGVLKKFITGFTCLIISIASMVVCFGAGQYFVLEGKARFAAYMVFSVTFLSFTAFAAGHSPLYHLLGKLLLQTFWDVRNPKTEPKGVGI